MSKFRSEIYQAKNNNFHQIFKWHRLAGSLLFLWTFVAAPMLQAQGTASLQFKTDELLVKVAVAAGARSTGVAAAQRGALAKAAHAAVGSTLLKDFPRIGWQRVRLPKGLSVSQAVARYKNLAGVVSVEPNYRWKALNIPNDARYSSLWGMTKIGAPAAWDISTGSSEVVVGVVDTGVRYTHEDLSANMWRNSGEIAGNGLDDDGNGFVDDIYGRDGVNNDSDPMDDNGHGTHCSGTIGGVANNSKGVAGVNWNVKIMALKFLDYSGYGSTTDAIECYEYATLMKQRGVNLRVISNSWGGGPFSQALKDAIDNAGNAGILSVCAAGNGGTDLIGDDNDSTPQYPASYDSPSIISVAASDNGDNRANFSNYGANSVDIAAPGVDILSSVSSADSSYDYKSGTSMATPHVAGAAALACSVNSSLSVAGLKGLLMQSVDPLTQWSGKVASGGRLNLARVMSQAGSNVVLTAPADNSIVEGDFSVRATTSDSSKVQKVEFARRSRPLTVSHAPNAAFPDFTSASDIISVGGQGNVGTATVSVNITHPKTGDLVVTLFAPDGTGTVLHNRISGTNVIKTYDITAALAGKPLNGNWELEVKDEVSDGSSGGTLNSWSLTVQDEWTTIGADTDGVDANGEWTASWATQNLPAGVYQVRALATLLNGSTVSDINSGIQIGELFSISDASVVEGNEGVTEAVFTVNLSKPSTQTVTVDYFTADGTALAGSDYLAANGTLTFAPGETSHEIRISIQGDTLPEDNETFAVKLANPSSGALLDEVGSGLIVSDELPTVSVSDVSVTEGNASSFYANFAVTLNTAMSQSVTVGYATANNTAVAYSDYSPTSGTLTFAPGITSKTVSVLIYGDTVDETDETFFLNLSNPNGVTLLDNQGIGTIVDDDAAPTITVKNASVVEGDNGTANLIFAATLSNASSQTVSANFATADDTAIADSDYALQNGVLTFPAGSLSKTITVPVAGDVEVENDENLFLNLSNPINGTLAATQAKGTIINDDGLKISNVAVSEGNNGTTDAVFTIILPTPVAQDVSVDYATADYTATAGSDYNAASGTITIAAGQTSATVAVSVVGDTNVEPNEVFLVNLSNAQNSIIADGQGVGTIISDEFGNSAGGKIAFQSTRSGNYQIYVMNADGSNPVRLSNNSYADYTPSFNADGSKIAFYSSRDGNYEIYSMNADGSGQTRLTNNSANDYSPRFNASGNRIVFYSYRDGNYEIYSMNADGSGQTRLTNNSSSDTLPSFSPDGSKIVFTSARDGNDEIYVMNADGSAQTRLTSISSADNAPRFSSDGSKIVFCSYRDNNYEIYVMNADGSGQTRVTNQASTDAAPCFSPDDSKIAFHSSRDGNYEIYSVNVDGSGPIRLTNDLAEDISPSWSVGSAPVLLTINDVSLNEGNEGTTVANFTVRLSGVSNQDITVDYATADGTAVAPVDYVAASGKLTIPAGQTSGTISVTVTGDLTIEGDEAFYVNLSNSNAKITDNQGRATLVSEELPKIVINDVTVDESSYYAYVDYSLFPATNTSFSFTYSTADGTATNGSDYTARSGSITTSGGSLSIPLISDTTDEDDETILFNLSNVSGAVLEKNQVTITIKDNDPTPILAVDDVWVSEGSSGTAAAAFKVSLSNPSSKPVTVNYVTADRTATAGTDYTAQSGTLTIPAGQVSGTINVPVLSDEDAEDNETFLLTFSNASAAIFGNGQAVATILNDDGLSINDVAIVEGNSGDVDAVFTISLSRVLDQDVTFDYITDDYTAKSDSDYGACSGTLTIPAGQNSATIKVPVHGDSLAETREVFFVRLNNVQGAGLVDGAATGAIINDDAASGAGKIAFHSDRFYGFGPTNIYVMNADGSNQTRVTTAFGDSTPSFSADGSKIVFVQGSNGVGQIAVVGADGSGLKTLTSGAYNNGYPAFSPDGSKIAFQSSRDGNYNIYVMNADGSAQTRLTKNLAADTAPCFSSDGNQIVFQSNRDGNTEIYSMNFDGSGQKQLTNNAANDAAPCFSPDGSRIAFQSTRNGYYNEIYVMNADGSNPVRLTSNSYEDAAPAFSPDGNQIVFHSTRTASYPEIYVMNIDGSGQTALTSNSATDAEPTWSIGSVPSTTISLSDIAVSEGDTASKDATFTLALSAASSQDITLDYKTVDGSAKADSDYAVTTGTLTIPAGQTSATVVVHVNGDTAVEANEVFILELTNARNAIFTRAVASCTIVNDDVTKITVNDVSVAEGNSGIAYANFTVNLSSPVSQSVAVTYSTADGTATASSDYNSVSGTLNFAANQTSKILAIPIIGDVNLEPDETFFLNLSNPVNAAIADAQGSATILNDDSSRVSVNDVTVAEGNSGTKDAIFTVSLDKVVATDISVDYTTLDGSAKAGADYTATTGKLVIPAGQPSATISIPVIGDTTIEEDENFSVSLSNPQGASLAKASGICIVTNDDLPAISVNDVSVTEGNSNSKAVTFNLGLSEPVAKTVTVSYTTADETAFAGSDYNSSNGTVTFAAGQVTAQVSIAVKGDIEIERDETFLLNLTNPINAIIIDGQGIATIVNDDVASLSIADTQLYEGDSGTKDAVFPVTLTSNVPWDVQVDYTTAAKTARAGTDFVETKGTLTIPAGQKSAQISVPIIGDKVLEPNETFSVLLSNPESVIISRGNALGTILTDDLPTVSVSDVTIVEGSPAADGTNPSVYAVFSVKLSAFCGTANTTVSYSTAAGTASSGVDYVPISGALTFAPSSNQLTQKISVPISSDIAIEPDETFFLNLTAADNATIENAQGVATIVNDDEAKISISDVTCTEGNTGVVNVSFYVFLSGAHTQTVTVDYSTANGTATQPSDYLPVNRTITFAPGQTLKIFTVPTVGDRLDEDNETFVVNLTNPTNAVIADAQGLGTIIDNDGKPSLRINDVVVNEGNEGLTAATFTVNLSPISGRTVTVNYATANANATQPGDYLSANGTISFAPGQTSQTISVPIVGDTLDENNEIFKVILSNAPNASIADSLGLATIMDDDAFPVLNIADASPLVEDGPGAHSLLFTVNLRGATSRSATVNYATSSVAFTGGATSGADFTPISGVLTFAPGQTQKTIAVPILPDVLDEANELVRIELSNANSAVVEDGSGQGSITDNDDAPSVSIDDVAQNEGNDGSNMFMFTVKLSAASGQKVVVSYEAANNTAIKPGDYIGQGDSLVFAPGETTKTISIFVNGDTAVEPDEAFYVNLRSAVNATISDNQGRGVILNDDASG